MSVALVAIAKNEGRFLLEWLAYNLTIGFDRILVYDNESTDDGPALLDALAQEYPIERIPWGYEPGKSPQIAAYNHAVAERLEGFEWVAFFDCDEFLFLQEDYDMAEFLARFGPEVGSVMVNWVTYGSSGRLTSDYELVTQAFRTGPPKICGNNRHLKTIARVADIDHMWIHHADLKRGTRVHPSGRPVSMTETLGVADKIDNAVAYLDHYQAKSREDFDKKIARGRAGALSDEPLRVRTPEDAEDMWKKLDRNEERHDHMDQMLPRFLPMYHQFRRILES